jgi:hypothetical protein
LLSLNRGRPAAATNFLRRIDELRVGKEGTQSSFSLAAAVFADGDQTAAESAARLIERELREDTLGVLTPDVVRQTSVGMTVLALWYIHKGDTLGAHTPADWVRRHSAGQPRNRVLAVLPAMMIESRARSAGSARLRAIVDSISLDGCCGLPDFVLVALARAYEESGDDVAALRVIRRGKWYQLPRNLATYLRDEGKIAARLGDRAGAIHAYEHYLALRSNPEPVLRPQRDSVLAELGRIKQAH